MVPCVQAFLAASPLLSHEFAFAYWLTLCDACYRFLQNLGPGMGELNNRLVQKGVPPELQRVEQIEAIVQQATQTAGRPAWAMDDWLS